MSTMSFNFDANAKIMARRKFDEERRARVLDPRNSKMGVDYTALDGQVEERRTAVAQQQASDEQIAADLREYDRMALILDRQQAELRKQRTIATAQYRITSQGKTTTDSYDLNRGDRVRSSMPARVGDDDSRNGPASLQKFAGEDLGYGERKTLMQQQMKAWTAEAAVSQAEAQTSAAEASRAQHALLMQQIASTENIDARNATHRAAKAATFKDANIELVAHKREVARQERLQQLELDQHDILSQVRGPLLSEDPALAFSPTTGKVLRDRFKGFSAEQLKEIRDAQTAQAREKVEAKKLVAEDTERIAARQAADVHTLLLAERREARARKQRTMATASVNLRTVEERKGGKAAGNGITYKNQIDDSFFSQFGTSHR